jgi:hypothetical protein
MQAGIALTTEAPFANMLHASRDTRPCFRTTGKRTGLALWYGSSSLSHAGALYRQDG